MLEMTRVEAKRPDQKILPQKLFITFGFVLMALSPFLTWLTASAPILFGLTVSRTGLELSPEIGFFALVFFIIGSLIVWFHKNPKHSGVVCLGMGIWMLIETLLAYVQLQDRLTSLSTDLIIVWIGPGFYLLAVGVFITIVGGILLLRKCSVGDQANAECVGGVSPPSPN